jgi:hypothetical protein
VGITEPIWGSRQPRHSLTAAQASPPACQGLRVATPVGRRQPDPLEGFIVLREGQQEL